MFAQLHPLGLVQFVSVAAGIKVANMVGQHGTRPRRATGTAPAPIRYDAVRQCLIAVASEAASDGASVHAPKFGAGLAGGDWSVIEPMIAEHLVAPGASRTRS